MFARLWPVFGQLIEAPFHDVELIWGIVPLYVGWMVNEFTSPKANFRTAVQTGFSFLWAGAHWAYQYSHSAHPSRALGVRSATATAAPLLVTGLVICLGLLAVVSGLRRRFPKYGSFLGHTRFANYFMISMFPIQSNCFAWSWDRLAAIALFAVPVWLAIELLAWPVHAGGKKR